MNAKKWPEGWIHHGRRRVWWAPWRFRCACGVNAYPCPALRQDWVRRQQLLTENSQLHADRLAAARKWQATQRARWGIR